MKRNDWILIISVLIYTLLFYKETPGVNFLIFNLAMVAGLAMKDKTLLKKRNWLVAAAGSLLSSFSVAWHGNMLSIVANVISLSVLSGLSYNAGSSVILSLLFSLYSYLSSPVYMVLDYLERRLKRISEKGGYARKIILISLPVAVTLIFFFLYRSSNALFDALADKINLDFISWNWILFTFWGAVLLYGFYYYKRIEVMAALDNNNSVNLLPGPETNLKLFGYELSMVDENFSGTLLFVLLNLLVLIVNVLDINFLFGDHKLPLGITDKQFVHQGVDMLITSIVIAISIILFFFRGGLNFYEKNKAIKILACLWVAQNAFMVFSTVCRNHLYIHEYGLTYKRIGVYMYLLLTVIGLGTTLIKVLKTKNNMYLFRKNGWIFYCLLIIFTLPNWEQLVTDYNINRLPNPDGNYLLSISNTNLAEMLPLYQKCTNDSTAAKDSVNYVDNFKAAYCCDLYNTLTTRNKYDWKSYFYDEAKMYEDITSKNFTNKVTMLDLSHLDIADDSIKTLAIFDKTTELHIHSREFEKVEPLTQFPLLQKLDLRNCNVYDLSGIDKLKDLQYLDLRGAPVIDFAPLFKLKNLRELYLDNMGYRYMGNAECKILCEHLPNTVIKQGVNN